MEARALRDLRMVRFEELFSKMFFQVRAGDMHASVHPFLGGRRTTAGVGTWSRDRMVTPTEYD